MQRKVLGARKVSTKTVACEGTYSHKKANVYRLTLLIKQLPELQVLGEVQSKHDSKTGRLSVVHAATGAVHCSHTHSVVQQASKFQRESVLIGSSLLRLARQA